MNSFKLFLFLFLTLILKSSAQENFQNSGSISDVLDQRYLGSLKINDEGTYAVYISSSELGSDKLIAVKTDGKWRREFVDCRFVTFENPNSLIYTDSSNAVFKVKLGYNEQASKISLLKNNTNQDFMVSHSEGMLSIKAGDKVLATYSDVTKFAEFDFCVIFIQRGIKDSVVCFDKSRKAALRLFVCEKNDNLSFNSTVQGNGYILFSKNESKSFNVQSNTPIFDVWSYKDPGAIGPYFKETPKVEWYAIFPNSFKVSKLCSGNERLLDLKGDVALIQDRFFSSLRKVITLRNSDIATINGHGYRGSQAKLSPNGSHVILSDDSTFCFYSYDVVGRKQVNLTEHLNLSNTRMALVSNYMAPIKWISDTKFTTSDGFDLWCIDVNNRVEPKNITKGLGRKDRIVFAFANVYDTGIQNKLLPNIKDGYLLTAFNTVNKEWGFYKLSINKDAVLDKLYMGPVYFGGSDPIIIKAKEMDRFVISMETSMMPPNYYFTEDFKSYTLVSNPVPKSITLGAFCELINWDDDSGRSHNGILYKPKSFSVHNRYPMVVIVYNEFSPTLYRYPDIKINELGSFNFLPVATLLKNDYVVFLPDVTQRKIGHPLEDSFDIVASGVKKVFDLGFVDISRTGIQGASWGSEQVNYILTRTSLFSAAFSGAGYSEHISGSGYVDRYFKTSQIINEEYRFGAKLGASPELYIQESPLLFANKISTPILLKNNIDDDAVPFYQGYQFFKVLSSLGKKVWMLNYPGGGHGVTDGPGLHDMNLRILQFFNHYLKKDMPPKWMTQVPSGDLRNMDAELELDKSGQIP